MRGLLWALLETEDALAVEGWTFSLGDEDCMACLRAVARGHHPFLGFYSQDDQDRRSRLLDVFVRADPEQLYRLREVAFDHRLRVEDHPPVGELALLRLYWAAPTSQSEEDEDAVGTSPPTRPLLPRRIRHEDLVARWLEEPDSDREFILMVIEAFVHAGALDVLVDPQGEVWYETRPEGCQEDDDMAEPSDER